MPKLDKMYPNTKPVDNPYTRDWVQEKIDEYLKKGGKVKQIPTGAMSITLQTEEKEKA